MHNKDNKMPYDRFLEHCGGSKHVVSVYGIAENSNEFIDMQ